MHGDQGQRFQLTKNDQDTREKHWLYSTKAPNKNARDSHRLVGEITHVSEGAVIGLVCRQSIDNSHWVYLPYLRTKPMLTLDIMS